MKEAAESLHVTRELVVFIPRRVKMSTVLLFYALRGYAQRIFAVHCAVLAIALSMDITENFHLLASSNDDAGVTFAGVLFYLLLRATDITTNLLAISVFLGVLWWEVKQAQLRERMSRWNGGQSPLQSLMAPLVLGLVLASTQASLDWKLRPLAVAYQIAGHLGVVGQRYDRRLSSQVSWTRVGDDIMSARIDYGPPAVLYDLTLFRMSDEGELREVIRARRALQTPVKTVWRMEDPIHGRDPYDSLRGSEPAQEGATASKSDSERLVFKLNPGMFKLHDVPARYLPQSLLHQLGEQSGSEPPVSDYKTWLQFRYARAFFPALMALLATTVALLDNGMHGRKWKYLIMFLSGYAAFSTVKLFVTMGELGFISPLPAAWGGIILVLMTIVLLQMFISRKIV